MARHVGLSNVVATADASVVCHRSNADVNRAFRLWKGELGAIGAGKVGR